VPASYFSKIKQGMGASVKPEMADASAQSAKVVVVDKVIDAASNSFRVRLELPNPNNQLPPGLRCKVDFDLGVPTAENVQPKPASAPIPAARPSADNAQPKPATAPSADSAPQKSVGRQSVAAAAAK